MIVSKSASMRVRLKSKYGTASLTDLDDSTSVEEFFKIVNDKVGTGELSNLSVSDLKTGFPPKAVNTANKLLPIKETGIKDGDQVMVTFAEAGQDASKTSGLTEEKAAVKPDSHLNSDIPHTLIDGSDEFLILRNIPDDNSCIFNSLSYALYGPDAYKPGGQCPPSVLREIVVDTILSRPDVYNEAILGRKVHDYCNWISKKDSWGGAIELGIFAGHFKIQINCLDIELGQFISFENENEKPSSFIILIYLGIHYDVLAVNKHLLNSESDKKGDSCLWKLESSQCDKIKEASLRLCSFLQTQNYSTNTTTFRVRCLICYKILIGEMGASKHANETGHFNFGEVK